MEIYDNFVSASMRWNDKATVRVFGMMFYSKSEYPVTVMFVRNMMPFHVVVNCLARINYGCTVHDVDIISH